MITTGKELGELLMVVPYESDEELENFIMKLINLGCIDVDAVLKCNGISWDRRGVKLSNGMYLPFKTKEEEPPRMESVEKEHVIKTLQYCTRHHKNSLITTAAKLLGLTRATMYHKIKEFEITKEMYT